MSQRYEEDDFVIEGGQVKLIIAVESRSELQENLDRFTLQAFDGTRFENIPAYGMKPATNDQVKTAMRK